MAFTVNDLQDLIALLAEKPEWRAQLRPLILGDEFDRLPAIMEELAEAQQRTEVSLNALTGRIDVLGVRLEELAEAQKRTEARVEELALEMRALASVFRQFNEMYEDDSGALYEVPFERKAPSLFGEWLRKPRAITLNDLDKVDEAEVAGVLSPSEAQQLRALDVIIVGLDGAEPGFPETILAVEVSRTLETADLDRAEARAQLLNKVGYRAKAAVGGKFAHEFVRADAQARGILVRLVDQVA